MQLSTTQQNALNRIIQFLKGDQQCFVLKGYAGTGKTTLMRHVVDYLKQMGVPYHLAAPTGRAAKNIEERIGKSGGGGATTIHSLIYEKYDEKFRFDEQEEQLEDIRVIFNLKKSNLDGRFVLIVDEASMISHIKQEQDSLIFGSGNLLADLFEFMSFDRANRKIIFVGDDLQLPPVTNSESAALNPSYLAQYFPTPIGYAELTEVFRQEAGELLMSATRLREEMLKETFDHLPIGVDNQEIFNTQYDKALHQYKEVYGKDSIFLAERNRDVHTLNKAFRELQGFSPQALAPNERLVVMKNAYIGGSRIYNGEFLFVVGIGDIEEKSVSYRKKGGGVETKLLVFQTLQVAFYDEENRVQTQTCKILLSKLWDETSSFTAEDRQALLTLFTMQYKDVKKNSVIYKELLSRDPYFNALYVRFGYAITCHKAQGGEWKHVFSLTEMSRNLYCLDSFRWLYTAITRAKNTVTFVNLPDGNKAVNEEDPFEQFRPVLYAKLQQFGYKLQKETPIAYGYKFYVEKDEQTAVLCLYYTGKLTFGAALKEKGSLEMDDLLASLAKIKGRKLSERVVI